MQSVNGRSHWLKESLTVEMYALMSLKAPCFIRLLDDSESEARDDGMRSA